MTEYQESYCRAKKQHKKLFSLHCTKIGQKTLIFDKQCVSKNAFLKNKRSISIDRVEIKRTVSSK